MPRPSMRTSQIEGAILSRLSLGEPLAKICRDEGMPTDQTWRDWCRDDESLALAYARAREAGEDALVVECLDIQEETPERYATEHGDRVDPGFVAWQRNRVETRLKLLAVWNPKRFGAKMDLTSGGEKIGGLAAAIEAGNKRVEG